MARENRKNPTTAERLMWEQVLRTRQLAGFKFQRQKPLGGYIVDFYCSELRLVIEIDGDSHAESVEYDQRRSNWLASQKLQVVRYTNDDVLHNREAVYADLITRTGLLSSGREPAETE